MPGEEDPKPAFRVTDRRGSTVPETAAPGGPAAEPAPQGPSALPEMDFITFVYSLAVTALVQMGEKAPGTDDMGEVNLALAKQNIDILAMLETKTRGNLTPDEERAIRGFLYELRMKFVAATTGGGG